METARKEGVHSAIPRLDLDLPHLHRAVYSQDVPFRAVVFDLRHRGVQEMGPDQGIVSDRMENPPLQPLGRQRV